MQHVGLLIHYTGYDCVRVSCTCLYGKGTMRAQYGWCERIRLFWRSLYAESVAVSKMAMEPLCCTLIQSGLIEVYLNKP